ncbi:Flp pilus assembly protein CpaB [Saccharomonospora marina XMU15]|uniref:Flp pilus assembly protein CpaB n=1 Tax=Saccharomonospora marina XMU15 TaxID=882083 RepID=H5WWX2_9PSEU|nr:RcpC/CpaB family pilus assembly protein [Saccharomonospora marina]EHR52800.1 Flp pilus assembly protein CpaB [Saccharomonospora marina XMU15]
MQAKTREQAWRQWLRGRVRARPAALVRRSLATTLFLLAVALAAIPGADVSGEALVNVVVTAREVPSGTQLAADDLRVAAVPTGIGPDGALGKTSDAIGRHLIGAARAGEPLTDARLAEHRRSPPGTATVPVRLADARIAKLLRPGTRVDVITPDRAGTDATRSGEHVVAGTVTVVAVPDEGTAARDGPAMDDQGALVLLAAPADTAARLAAVSLEQPITVTLR